MTSKRSGKQLRYDILHYLLDRERSHGSNLAGLDEIADVIKVSKEDALYQIDILESQSAIKSNKTFGNNVSPMLTGIGKVMLEEMEENIEFSSDKKTIKPEVDHTQLPEQEIQWDAFICHASEDKKTFVRSLANELTRRGAHIWYDEFTLKLGDSLRRSIDKGLAKSRYGIVILSQVFFKKEWPQKELDGLFELNRNGQKVMLPVWLDVSHEDVARFSPLLADLIAAKASEGVDKVSDQLWDILSSSLVMKDILNESSIAASRRNTVYTNSITAKKISFNHLRMVPPFPAIAFYVVHASKPFTENIRIDFYASGISSASKMYFWSQSNSDWLPCSSQGIASTGTYLFVNIADTTVPALPDLTGIYFAMVQGKP